MRDDLEPGDGRVGRVVAAEVTTRIVGVASDVGQNTGLRWEKNGI